MEIRFDTYYTYQELLERLQWLAGKYPGLLELRTLGLSREGREIPLMVITNKQTGPLEDKPGFWIDGCIHSTEISSAMAVLYAIVKLVEGYGQLPYLTRVVDELVIYAVPCINPDGVQLALSSQPKHLRSGTAPHHDEMAQGLYAEDIDGDGRILQMRVPDPAGDWRVSDNDSRLMIKRAPDEEEGEFYRLFSEGRFANFDSDVMHCADTLASSDFNRNFPGNWRPKGVQKGAGEYPGSEPEVAAILQFFAEHKNIYGALTFHTFSRVILRPFSSKGDEEMDTNDLWVYQAIGKVGSAKTGYPCVSVFHDFKYHPKEIETGAFDDWVFEELGIFAFTVELWDLPTAAGIKEKNETKNFIGWMREHPIEEDYRILEFIKENADRHLVDWYPFEHPQLGKVELGGWQRMYTWRNPPPHLLEEEIAPQLDFIVAFALLAPRLNWRKIDVLPLGDGHYSLSIVIENLGFLPTYISQQALKMKAVALPYAEIALPSSGKILRGKNKVALSHLEGRSNKMDISYASASPPDNRCKVEWLLCLSQETTVQIKIHTQKGGCLEKEIDLAQIK